jgi:hypothetical protein
MEYSRAIPTLVSGLNGLSIGNVAASHDPSDPVF